MRVITGSIGGQVFDAPNKELTHAMSEKMRGSIFSALGDISGLSVLDVYAGSGALSIEAISRGAKSAVAIESDKKAATIIKKNTIKLDIQDKIKVVNAYFLSWNRTSDIGFDLIFADPPYDKLPLKEINLLIGHLNPKGLFVLSWPGRLSLPNLRHTKLIKTKSFNDSQLGFYRLEV